MIIIYHHHIWWAAAAAAEAAAAAATFVVVAGGRHFSLKFDIFEKKWSIFKMPFLSVIQKILYKRIKVLSGDKMDVTIEFLMKK